MRNQKAVLGTDLEGNNRLVALRKSRKREDLELDLVLIKSKADVDVPDFAKAFDSVNHDVILKKLKSEF